jgi:hypothetical protein
LAQHEKTGAESKKLAGGGIEPPIGGFSVPRKRIAKLVATSHVPWNGNGLLHTFGSYRVPTWSKIITLKLSTKARPASTGQASRCPAGTERSSPSLDRAIDFGGRAARLPVVT